MYFKIILDLKQFQEFLLKVKFPPNVCTFLQALNEVWLIDYNRYILEEKLDKVVNVSIVAVHH